MRTVTKKEVAKRVAKQMGQKIYITEEFVNSVFQSLREILSEADRPPQNPFQTRETAEGHFERTAGVCQRPR